MHAGAGRRRKPTSSSASTRPRDITRVEYGGRLYNRAPHSHIDFLHSFDGGKTWTQSYSLTNTAPPWDVIHYETVDAVPPGTRSVLFKYRLQSSAAGPDACSLYAVRMEANHQPAERRVQAARSDLPLERTPGGLLARRTQPHARS